MLFNSYVFLLAFLPTVLLGFTLLGQKRSDWALAWLVLCSLFFYGWWNPLYLWLIGTSMALNFGLARKFSARNEDGTASASRVWLVLGVAANLGFLGWFKYAGFFVANVNALLGDSLPALHVVLPLAISFFTFQQIAYMVDAWRGETREHSFLHYCLFVCFFPQLIAGPIVHHKEILAQFRSRTNFRLRSEHLAVGGTLFFAGLFKKTVFADGISTLAVPVYDAARDGAVLSFFEAWQGTLAYTLQIYFDFSGYSDMAIGLGFLFGVRLPLNFHSPYQSLNIVDFWRRWHITLSRFLRDYLYIPLGGNRKGKRRRYVNLMLTMLLGGLWHGAAWTFVIWGGLHGLYLVINHGWGAFKRRVGSPWLDGRGARAAARALTFAAVVLAWVFFRAESMDAAWTVLSAMLGLGPAVGAYTAELLPAGHSGFLWIAVLLVIVLFAPNTQQILGRHQPALDAHLLAEGPRTAGRFSWRPSTGWALATALMTVVAILCISRESEFLYFQF